MFNQFHEAAALAAGSLIQPRFHFISLPVFYLLKHPSLGNR
jgi:hypothetical protein